MLEKFFPAILVYWLGPIVTLWSRKHRQKQSSSSTTTTTNHMYKLYKPNKQRRALDRKIRVSSSSINGHVDDNLYEIVYWKKNLWSDAPGKCSN